MPWDVKYEENMRPNKHSDRIGSKGHRGIIFSDVIDCTIWREGSTGMVQRIPKPFDVQRVSSYTLFWDSLIKCTKKIDAREDSPEEQFLKQIGILKEMIFDPGLKERGDDMAIMFTLVGDPRDLAFTWLENEALGQWAVGYSEDEAAQKSPTEGRAALVTLSDAISVPDHTVPLEDIVEFRERRRPELIAVRSHIDKLYLQIVSAGDGPIAINEAIGGLQKALIDNNKVAQESGFKLRLMGIEARLKMDIDLPFGALAGAAALSTGLGSLGSLLTGGIASIRPRIELQSGANLTKSSINSSPIDFVTKFRSEVFNNN